MIQSLLKKKLDPRPLASAPIFRLPSKAKTGFTPGESEIVKRVKRQNNKEYYFKSTLREQKELLEMENMVREIVNSANMLKGI